jgi:hypothetical protein
MPEALMTEWDEGTLDNGRYTKMSKMYQLGKLLKKEFSCKIISKDGQDFGAMLEAKKMTV